MKCDASAHVQLWHHVGSMQEMQAGKGRKIFAFKKPEEGMYFPSKAIAFTNRLRLWQRAWSTFLHLCVKGMGQILHLASPFSGLSSRYNTTTAIVATSEAERQSKSSSGLTPLTRLGSKLTD